MAGFTIKVVNKSGVLIPHPTNTPSVTSTAINDLSTYASIAYVNTYVSNQGFVNTTGNFTLAGNINFTGVNTYFGSNSTHYFRANSSQTILANSNNRITTTPNQIELFDVSDEATTTIIPGRIDLLGALSGAITIDADGTSVFDNQIQVSNLLFGAGGTIDGSSYSGQSNSTLFLGNSSGTLANIASWSSGNASTAYTNAITFASNATNISSGTLGNGRLSSAVVNTSGNFTVAGNINFTSSNNRFTTNGTHYSSVNGPEIISTNGTKTTSINPGILYATGAGEVIVDADLGSISTSGPLGGSIYLDPDGSSVFDAGISLNSGDLYLASGKLYFGNDSFTVNSTIYTGQALTANIASFLGNSSGTLANIASWSSGNGATAYSNAILFAANATNLTTGTLDNARLTSAIVNTSGNFTLAGNINFIGANNYFGSNGTHYSKIDATSISITEPSNIITISGSNIYLAGSGEVTISSDGILSSFGPLGGSINLTPDGTSTFDNGISLNSGDIYLSVGKVYFGNDSFSVNSTIYTGTAWTSNLSSYLGNSSGTLANIASWVSGNSGTAYTNAITIASNATNLTTGTLDNGRLTSAVVNTSGNFTLAGNINFTGANNHFGANDTHYAKINSGLIQVEDPTKSISISPSQIYLYETSSGEITISGDGSYTAYGPLGGSIFLSPDVESSFDNGININSGDLYISTGKIYFSNDSFTVNSTIYTGQSLTSNLASYLGNSSGTIANIASWASGNGATAYTNAVSYVDSRGQTKSLTVSSPVNTDIITMFYTTRALTINNAIAVLPSGANTPNVTFSIISGSSRGTESVFNVNAQSVSNITSGSVISVANASVASNNFVWAKITGVSGTVPEFHISIKFNELF